MHYRDVSCNALSLQDVGKIVTLSGWVSSFRDHGGIIFIDLRDREGITQIVFRPELDDQLIKKAESLRVEDVVTISGEVVKRIQDTENSKILTGFIEVVAQSLVWLNHSDVLPFSLDQKINNEDVRLNYRYLDLRRPSMLKNLHLRHRVIKLMRDILSNEGYWEVETPILSKSTPEGARDFLVPSRLNPRSFYALPQAPQQYKQLLMIAGVEKYFQVARCFRDEDLRSDRQPEFTQLDIEASFIKQKDIFTLIEKILHAVFKETQSIEIPIPFLRMSYNEALNRFGSDKPDTRFNMELKDVSKIFQESQFKVFRQTVDTGGVVKAINAKSFAHITTGQIETLTDIAKSNGAKGLAFIKVENEKWQSPIVKFFSEEEKNALREALNIESGDLILFSADQWENSCVTLGRIRLNVAKMQSLISDNNVFNFLWVVDFPLLHLHEDGSGWHAVHHPFTRPKYEDMELFNNRSSLHKIRAEAYDIVLNGVEIGGGSLRIHESLLQSQLFSLIGLSEENQEKTFGHLLKALRYGAPPHGGIALGIDRLLAIVAKEESIREVIAFPKNNRGTEILTGSPATVEEQQLRELSIFIKKE